MRKEPSLSQETIRHALRDAYHVRVRSLQFQPSEWFGYCYRVETEGGGQLFLKVQDLSDPPRFERSSVGFALQVTRQLHDTGILPHVPYPLGTADGRLCTEFMGHLFAVYPYVQGRLVGLQGLTPSVLAQLGRLVGRLHRSLPALRLDAPFAEDFTVPFLPELSRVLSHIDGLASSSSTVLRELGRLLGRRREELRGHMAALQDARTQAAAESAQNVVCHTDLHGENLMLDENGRLWILDWDTAMLAPPEQDLFFFAGHDTFWTAFLPAYSEGHRPVSISPTLLRFYYYRRTLEDMADWIDRIIRRDGEPRRDRQDLQEVGECLDDLGRIERTVAEIHTRLLQRGH
jgi:Ser/Thr protein kinase RdoA (MazF antagonist)